MLSRSIIKKPHLVLEHLSCRAFRLFSGNIWTRKVLLISKELRFLHNHFPPGACALARTPNPNPSPSPPSTLRLAIKSVGNIIVVVGKPVSLKELPLPQLKDLGSHSVSHLHQCRGHSIPSSYNYVLLAQQSQLWNGNIFSGPSCELLKIWQIPC